MEVSLQRRSGLSSSHFAADSLAVMAVSAMSWLHSPLQMIKTAVSNIKEDAANAVESAARAIPIASSSGASSARAASNVPLTLARQSTEKANTD